MNKKLIHSLIAGITVASSLGKHDRSASKKQVCPNKKKKAKKQAKDSKRKNRK